MVARERQDAGKLARVPVECRWKPVLLQYRYEPAVQSSDGARVQRDLLAPPVANPQHDRMSAEIERQRESTPAARRCRVDPEAAGIRLKCDMPAVIEPRRMRDADLADHLRGEMKESQRLVVALGA